MKKVLALLIAFMLMFCPIALSSAEDNIYKIYKVNSIVDGDTVDVTLSLGFNIFFNTRVRLNGINTPESRTSDLREKELGLKAKEFTSNFIATSSGLTLVVEKREKFGRELGKILNQDGKSLGDELISAGLAREYHGEKRNGWFADAAAEPKLENL